MFGRSYFGGAWFGPSYFGGGSDVDALAALLASGSIIIRDYLTVHGFDDEDEPVTFGFWTGEDDVSVDIVSAIDGETVSRDFIGGALPESGIPPIVDALGLEARSLELRLSQIHAAVQDMVRGHNIRVSVVEVHRGFFDPRTYELAAPPSPRFLGRIDGALIDTPAVGGEGAIALTAVGDAIDLTRVNPALKSDEQQKLRSGDRFRRYADTAGAIEVFWGQAKGTAESKQPTKGGKVSASGKRY